MRFFDIIATRGERGNYNEQRRNYYSKQIIATRGESENDNNLDKCCLSRMIFDFSGKIPASYHYKTFYQPADCT